MSGSLHTPAYRRFLQALVAFRKAKGVTQVQLAERIGRTQVWVSKNERGDRRLDVLEIVEIARGMGVQPADITALAEAALDQTEGALDGAGEEETAGDGAKGGEGVRRDGGSDGTGSDAKKATKDGAKRT